MFSIAILASVFLCTTLLPLDTPQNVAPFQRTNVSSSLIGAVKRPNIVENGTDVVLFPLPANAPAPSGDHSVAFTPNGDAYFLAYLANSLTGQVVRAAPDGTTTAFLTVERVDGSGQIVYAGGKLWMFAERGVVSMSPDGSKQRWYDLGAVTLGGLTVGPDGSIYVAAGVPNPVIKYGTVGRIFRIDRSGGVTSVSIPGAVGSMAFGGDGKLYFAFYRFDQVDGIGRVEADGSLPLFPFKGYENAEVNSLVYANGKLFFSAQATLDSTIVENSLFGTVATSGAITNYAIPGGATNSIGFLTADFGGNLWTSVGPPSAPDSYVSQLYQFNTYRGHFSGPYEPSKLASIFGGPFVGPDDNVWLWLNAANGFLRSYGAFVGHVATLEPASISIVTGVATPFTILETHFNGPWTARSSSPSVATVSPATSATGDFSVTETGPGTSSIAVVDRFGNISYESVTAR
jgi:hypothetical protein